MAFDQLKGPRKFRKCWNLSKKIQVYSTHSHKYPCTSHVLTTSNCYIFKCKNWYLCHAKKNCLWQKEISTYVIFLVNSSFFCIHFPFSHFKFQVVICKLRSEGTTTERSRQHWRAAKALLVIFPLLGTYVSIFKFWRPFFTLYSLPNWHLYFIIIRHFLYHYLNGSYRGNSWTSGLPIRQSFFAVYSGLYL